ncbi:MAG: MFS transporter [Alphaproteobacteria bacterium]
MSGEIGPAQPLADRRERVVPWLVACALFMENLDSAIIATALPAIATALDEDPVELSLAITSYLLSLAVFIPVSGWMADRFGGRMVFRAAIVVFMVGSIACGLATSLESLVLARVLQGAGGAMMVPVGRLVLLRAVPKSRLLRAMAFVTIPGLIGPVIGPPLGGLIATYASWRWIFFINVPIALLGVVLVSVLIGNEREAAPRPLDARGFVLTGLALVGLLFGLQGLGRAVVPGGVTAALIVGGAVAAGLYVVHARSLAHPIIDLALLRIPTFRAAIVGGLFFRISIGAIPLLLPMMLQLGFGLTPFASGAITFAGAAGALTMKVAAAPILRAVGFRRALLFNSVVSGVLLIGYGLFEPTTPHLVIVAVLLVGGFFRSLQFTALNTLCYADAAPEQMSRATSLVSVAQQVSQGVGVGLAAVLLHLTLALRGSEALDADAFDVSYLTIGALSFAAILFFRRLAPDAGAEISGHRAR